MAAPTVPMMKTLIKIQQTTSDRHFTSVESHEVLTTVFGSLLSFMVITFGVTTATRFIGSESYSEGEAEEIARRAGLVLYEPRLLPPGVLTDIERGSSRRPKSTRVRQIGAYEVFGETLTDTWRISLYEYRSGWKKKTIAKMTVDSYAQYNQLFIRTTEVIKQVRFEKKTQIRRSL